MMLMAIDHVRDYVARSAMQFLPTDLSRTSAAIFFTRWITHFCAPVFMLTAGLGAFFWMSRGHHSKTELSRFLITRGIWLIFLEITVLRLILLSQISFFGAPIILMILWAIGLSMIALAALIYLPIRLLATLSIAIIALHNLLDGIPAARFEPALGPATLSGVAVETDDATGLAVKVAPVRVGGRLAPALPEFWAR